MGGEPVTGQYRHPLEAAGFFEKVGGAGNHNKPALARHRGLCAAVQFQHHGVAAPHDQQCRRDHVGQRLARQIGPSPTRHHSCHLHPGIGGRDPGPTQPVTSTSRRASSSMSKTLARLRSSAGVSKSNTKVARPARLRTSATYRLRGPCLLLPLPWANTTTPEGCSGIVRCPATDTGPALTQTSSSRSGGSAAPPAAAIRRTSPRARSSSATTSSSEVCVKLRYPCPTA